MNNLDVADLDKALVALIARYRKYISTYEPFEVIAFGASTNSVVNPNTYLNLAIVMDSLPDTPFNVKMDFAGKVFDMMMSFENVDVEFMISAFPFSKAQFEGSEESVFSRLIPLIRQNGILIPSHI